MTTEQLLIAALRAVLCGEPLAVAPTLDELQAAYKLALRHDLSHLVYTAFAQQNALPAPETEEQAAFLKQAEQGVLIAQYRYARLEAELAHIGQVFEREGIDYVPLKGAVLRVLYPEAWMRTSCDIDVLVREPDLDRAVAALTAEGFTTDGVRNMHDISLYCDDVHLELHHNLLERVPAMDAVLETVWTHTVSKGHRHLETPAFFLFHHIAHMAHHFLCGGCGVRTVMDLWLLLKHSSCAPEELRALLQAGDLEAFARQMIALADVWFGTGEHTEQTRRVEQFVPHGGAYGSKDQRSATSAARHGKGKLALRVIFMPYEDLRHVYPNLDGRPYLTFFYQLCRIGTRLKQGRGGGAVQRIREAGQQSEDTISTMQAFLQSVGLYQKAEDDV